MVQIEEDVQEKLRNLLKELFQFDNQDLDFGIYKIMNYKRKEIEKFIDEDLIAEVNKQFKEYSQVGQDTLRTEINKLRNEILRDFGEGTIDSEGRVNRNEDAPKIKQYILKMKSLEELAVIESQITDIFNSIYEFFSRYYEKGDFISKKRYGGKEKYYVPYNGDEICFHWTNKDQYYVKSEEYFKKYRFRIGSWWINFVLDDVQIELNNDKGEKKFFILRDEANPIFDDCKKELSIYFVWRPLSEDEKRRYGTRNVQDALGADSVKAIAKAISHKDFADELKRRIDGDKTVLEKHLENYLKKNVSDYFIHKNLRWFLDRELDFYIKNELIDIDELVDMNEDRIRIHSAKIRVIKKISRRIIEFLSQIEDFQKTMFEKKKFVISSEYCITLDLIPQEFYDEIGKNISQVTEWKELLNLDNFYRNTLQRTDSKKTLSTEFLKHNKSLIVDTKHFSSEFKNKLLSSFTKIDEQTNGLLIKSENFQALNFILKKYGGKIKCIYIDPPYNTGNDGFIYKDNYQHSSWLSMMADRLALASELMTKDGVFYVSVDDNEQANLKLLMNLIFGIDNFIASIAWWKRHGRNNNAKLFSDVKDFLLLFRKSNALSLIREPRTESSNEGYSNPDNDPRGPWTSISYVNPATKAQRPNLVYPIKNPRSGQEVVHPLNAWKYSRDECKRHASENRLYWGQNYEYTYPRLKIFLSEVGGLVPMDVWNQEEAGTTDEGSGVLEKMFGGKVFDNPKPPKLIEKMLKPMYNNLEDRNFYFLDFFGGSGSSAEAVINVNESDNGNRKYIIVEMGDHFDNVIVPRIKKCIFAREWKDGMPIERRNTSHLFKYILIEQYEDTLNNIVFRSKDKLTQQTLDKLGGYFLHYMLDFETANSPSRLTLDSFRAPFEYKLFTGIGIDLKETTIDLIETFNYLLGLDVKRSLATYDGERLYRVVIGSRLKETIVIIWRNTANLDLDKDKKYIEEKIICNQQFDVIYVNGDSYLRNAHVIEPEFKRLMGA